MTKKALLISLLLILDQLLYDLPLFDNKFLLYIAGDPSSRNLQKVILLVKSCSELLIHLSLGIETLE